jgi:hypothetical protein
LLYIVDYHIHDSIIRPYGRQSICIQLLLLLYLLLLLLLLIDCYYIVFILWQQSRDPFGRLWSLLLLLSTVIRQYSFYDSRTAILSEGCDLYCCYFCHHRLLLYSIRFMTAELRSFRKAVIFIVVLIVFHCLQPYSW